MGNFVDKAIGFFNPVAGLRRHHVRQALTRAYEGASKRDGWKPKRAGASANTDHFVDASELRTRSRALVQNVPYVAQGLRALVANVVGTGIVPNWLGRDADKLNAAWAEWVKQADADGRLDLYGIQAAAYRAMEQDGEVLIRLRPRRATDGLVVPLQLQLLEIDWLDSSRASRSERSGNTIVNGIEYDPLGRVAGYWLWDQHPGELTLAARMRTSSHFVSAENIIHLFTPDRPGQGRGFPRIAPVIARVRDLQVYEDAELQRKNLESRLSVLASGDVQLLGQHDETKSPDQTSELGSLAGGNIMQLPTGMNVTVVDPKAAPGYVEYVKWALHLISAGFGVTYEMMTGDVSEVNFSSARVRMLDFRREAEMTQWTLLVPRLCDRICRAFADAAVLGELIKEPNYRVDHATPKWDYVNPAQDVKADLDEIAGGLSSISEKLRRRGYKPDAVFKELASDVERLKELGLLDVMLMLQKGRQMGDGASGSTQPTATARSKAGGG
jgi:lambda family phage portal protein